MMEEAWSGGKGHHCCSEEVCVGDREVKEEAKNHWQQQTSHGEDLGSAFYLWLLMGLELRVPKVVRATIDM
ncbi:hypothetical protein IAQ61_003012 [Plenodomus lingam]|uniref:uncharacterized protein n=1 Tax=Leptosphaeria maculans TaxID=5022 RepID=UPI00331ED664|nr:hypothetical protein IAQ61_003012 [Plenodomus lingam]